MIKKKIFVGFFSIILFFGIYVETSMAGDYDYGCNLGSRQRLALIKNYAESQGLSCRGRVNYGYFRWGQKKAERITLYGGSHYLLIGVGNEHGRDLDLSLYNNRGQLISADRRARALSVVEIHPRWTERYYLQAHMYSGKGCANVMICN